MLSPSSALQPSSTPGWRLDRVQGEGVLGAEEEAHKGDLQSCRGHEAQDLEARPEGDGLLRALHDGQVALSSLQAEAPVRPCRLSWTKVKTVFTHSARQAAGPQSAPSDACSGTIRVVTGPYMHCCRTPGAS